MMRRAEIAQRNVWFTLQPLIKRQCNVRLADTRLARKKHHPTFFPCGLAPSAQQQIYLFLTSNSDGSLLVCIASNRLSTPLVPSTCEADMGWAQPLSESGPRSR